MYLDQQNWRRNYTQTQMKKLWYNCKYNTLFLQCFQEGEMISTKYNVDVKNKSSKLHCQNSILP